MIEVTSRNRDHASQQLVARLKQAPGRAVATVAVIDHRKTRGFKYSHDARLVLPKVWTASGGSCGHYLAPAMTDWLDAMEAERGPKTGRRPPQNPATCCALRSRYAKLVTRPKPSPGSSLSSCLCKWLVLDVLFESFGVAEG